MTPDEKRKQGLWDLGAGVLGMAVAAFWLIGGEVGIGSRRTGGVGVLTRKDFPEAYWGWVGVIMFAGVYLAAKGIRALLWYRAHQKRMLKRNHVQQNAAGD